MTANPAWPDTSQAHAWLRAATLPQAWQSQSEWTVLDLEFGAGELFFACWQVWRDDAHRPSQLFYSALLPRLPDFSMVQAGMHSAGLCAEAQAALQAQWPMATPGVHQLCFEQGRVRLFLALGESHDTLPQRVPQAQTVFLRQPANQPAWSAGSVRAACAMLAQEGRAVLARNPAPAGRTETASAEWTSLCSAVESAGLVVQAVSASSPSAPDTPLFYVAQRRFGRAPRVERWAPSERHALVVGAGLAGSAVALALARRGWQVEQWFDANGHASATAGQPALAYHPSVTPDDAPLSRLLRHALLWTRAHYDLGWVRWHGRIQLETEARAHAAVTSMPAAWAVSLNAKEASDRAGRALRSGGLWLPLAGSVDPNALCQTWRDHPGVVTRSGHVAHLVHDANGWRADDAAGRCLTRSSIVVIATGAAAPLTLHREGVAQPLWNLFAPATLQWRAGRSVLAQLAPGQRGLACAVGAAEGGHALPLGDGQLVIGPVAVEQDGAAPGAIHAKAATGDPAQLAVDRWACCLVDAPVCSSLSMSNIGVRLSTRDHRPLIGRIAGWPDLWLASGLGGRGLLWSVLAAEVIAAELNAEPYPLPRALRRSIAPERFQSG